MILLSRLKKNPKKRTKKTKRSQKSQKRSKTPTQNRSTTTQGTKNHTNSLPGLIPS